MKKILIALQLVLATISFGQVVPGQNFGTDATGAIVPLPIGGKVASTSTALAANQSWVSDTFWYAGNNNIQIAIQTDVVGIYTVEYFNRNGTKIPFMGTVTNFDPTVVTAFQAAIAGKGDGVRISFTNGPVAQSTFYLEIGLLSNTVQETLRSMGATMSATNFGGVTHSAIEGRDSSKGSAPFQQVTTSVVGKKVGMDVNVINRSNDTQRVTIPLGVNVNNFPTPPTTQTVAGSVTVSNLDTSVTITSPLPTGSNTIGNVGINGTVPVSGTFYLANQPVSGTVAVSNPYTVNATDSIKFRKTVSVDNFPATQTVAGTVTANVTFPSTQAVTGAFYPATQPVSGSVSVSNLPSSQTVSGSVAVTNPYSVVATDSTKYRKVLSIDNFPATSVNAGDSTKYRKILSIDNYPASQAVTATSLPLPSGASTAANQATVISNQATMITNTGNVADTAITDQTKSASVISLLKGLLAESVSQATSATFTAYTLTANVAQAIAAAPGRKSVKITSTNGTILIGVGFTATATNYIYRIVTNGTVEIMMVDAALSVSLFATSGSTVNVATSN